MWRSKNNFLYSLWKTRNRLLGGAGGSQETYFGRAVWLGWASFGLACCVLRFLFFLYIVKLCNCHQFPPLLQVCTVAKSPVVVVVVVRRRLMTTVATRIG